MTKRIAEKQCNGGIYRITCTANGKSYIGSTSYQFNVRWRKHRSHLNRSLHHSDHLQNAWNKYGADSFEFNQLESVQFVKDLIDCEQKWIDIYQACDRAYGFNIAPRADRTACSEETKAKLRALNLGKTPSAETRMKIGAAHLGRKRSEESKARMSAAQMGKTHSVVSKAKNSAVKVEINPFYYRAIAPDGTVYDKILSLNQFCKEMNLSRSLMSKVAKGMYRQGKGWTCNRFYKKDDSEAPRDCEENRIYYRAIAPDGTVHDLIPYLRSFCLERGLSQAHMSSVVSGKRQQHKGWTCEKVKG